jgi:hypothetical protein
MSPCAIPHPNMQAPLTLRSDAPCQAFVGEYSGPGAPPQQHHGRPDDTNPSATDRLCLRFTVPEFVTHMGASLAIVGGVPELGSWDASKALRLAWAPGNRWSADVDMPAGWTGTMEYKVRTLLYQGINVVRLAHNWCTPCKGCQSMAPHAYRLALMRGCMGAWGLIPVG